MLWALNCEANEKKMHTAAWWKLMVNTHWSIIDSFSQSFNAQEIMGHLIQQVVWTFSQVNVLMWKWRDQLCNAKTVSDRRSDRKPWWCQINNVQSEISFNETQRRVSTRAHTHTHTCVHTQRKRESCFCVVSGMMFQPVVATRFIVESWDWVEKWWSSPARSTILGGRTTGILFLFSVKQRSKMASENARSGR